MNASHALECKDTREEKDSEAKVQQIWLDIAVTCSCTVEKDEGWRGSQCLQADWSGLYASVACAGRNKGQEGGKDQCRRLEGNVETACPARVAWVVILTPSPLWFKEMLNTSFCLRCLSRLSLRISPIRCFTPASHCW
ncbi:unnamed protein product [Durusdinium trenchii]|uniref:Uncharacterized protein n=1 Tax=Durusdinium trenchii TaxID=1381693 RepID=A0ABP0NUA0_9DINO